MKQFILSTFLALFVFFGVTNQALADDPIYTGTFSNTALKGYDSVSYFVGDGSPVKGSKDLQTQWRGAKWLFASQENLNAFKATPEKYAPQYGGYCAWAAAHDTLAKGDPLVYHLEYGKLYLNYNKDINKQWFARKAELISVANEKYPDLVDLK